jgi:hypothetical protein
MDVSQRKRIALVGAIGLMVMAGLGAIAAVRSRSTTPDTAAGQTSVAPALAEGDPTAQAAPAAPPGDPSGATLPHAAATGAVVYDPTKLLERDVPAAEVWDKEPRSHAWADATETMVGGAMRRDLEAMVPGAAVVLKCRTLSCLVGIDAPEDKRPAALAVTKFLTFAPWVVDLPAEDDGTLRWLFFEEPRFSDGKTFVDWYAGARKRKLADIHAGKAPNPFPVSLENVPKD